MKQIANNKTVVLLGLMVLLSFTGVFQYIFSFLGLNNAYMIDQMVPAIAGIYLGFKYLNNSEYRTAYKKMGWIIPLVIAAAILYTHKESFNRTYFDEYTNLFRNFRLSAEYGLASSSDTFRNWREIYAWGPFVTLYNLLGGGGNAITLPIMLTVGFIGMIGGAIALAWLAMMITGSRIAALITGLLFGINPNSFAQMPFISNIIGDNWGLMLACLTLGVFIVARRYKSMPGFLVSLFLLAVTLKSGGAVRIMTLGGVMILTDMLLMPKYKPELEKPRKWIAWAAIMGVTLLYAFTNPAIVGRSGGARSLETGLAGLAEGTTYSFLPPTKMPAIYEYLHTIDPNRIWAVELGGYIFLAGSVLALLALLSKRYRIWAWGWAFFYGMIFFAPFTGDWAPGSLTAIRDIVDPLFAGYKYAYVPLAGIYLAIAAMIAITIHKRRWTAAILLPAIAALIWFRAGEFMQLDKGWNEERSVRDKAGLEVLVNLPKDVNQVRPLHILATGKHNPLARQEAGIFPVYAFYDETEVFMFTDRDEYNLAVKDLKNPRAFEFNWIEEEKRFE